MGHMDVRTKFACACPIIKFYIYTSTVGVQQMMQTCNMLNELIEFNFELTSESPPRVQCSGSSQH